jgi:hypothetical protein
MLLEQAFPLAAIGFQVKELHRGQVLLSGCGLARRTPATASCGQTQFPIAFADGKRTAN